MAVARRTEVVAGFMAGIFGCVGLLLFLFVPYFEADTLHVQDCNRCAMGLFMWPEHYSLFYRIMHVPDNGALGGEVARLCAGYLLLLVLVALAAMRQERLERHLRLHWTVLLWLATAMLAVEVVSVSVNARSLVLPFLIPEVDSTYLVTYLLPSVAFAVVSALAAVAVVTGALTHQHT
jgi:hypothetical protein